MTANEHPAGSEAHGVTEALHLYFSGASGAPGDLDKVFYSSCNLTSVDADGRLELVPFERFRTFAERGGLAAHRTEVLSVQTRGQMAFAHVAFRFETHCFEDFLTLFRLDGRWRIVSKCYVTLPASGAEVAA